MSFSIGSSKSKKGGEGAKKSGRHSVKDLSNSAAANFVNNMADEMADEFDDGETGLDILLEQANDCLTRMDFETAQGLLNEAKAFAEDNDDKATVLDLMGQVLTELNETENAIAVFKEAESLDPNGSFERLLALGQLSTEFDSLNYYKAGLMLLHQELFSLGGKRKNESSAVTSRRNEISETASMVMCSMADLYVTDLCDEDGAEKECEHLLEEAIKICATNCEAFRALANLRTIQGNKPQATIYILHAYKLLTTAINQGKDLPEFFAKVELAKLLLELEQWKEACEMYALLLDENNQFIELWYQCGVAHANLARVDVQNKTEHEYGAAQFLLTAQKLLAQDPDEELQTSIDNQLRVLSELGIDLEVARSALDEAKMMYNEEGSILSEGEGDDDDEEMN